MSAYPVKILVDVDLLDWLMAHARDDDERLERLRDDIKAARAAEARYSYEDR